MRVCKGIDYEKLGITEENNWKDSYNWVKMRKFFRVIEIFIVLFCIILFKTVGRSILIEYSRINCIVCCLLALIVHILILTPIHEVLHFLPFTRNIFGDKCVIILGKNTVSAFYNGEVTRNQLCVSLVLPFFVIGTSLILLIVTLGGLIRLFLIFSLLLHCVGCYSDIYMFFYTSHKFTADTMFYGNKYRTDEHKLQLNK